MRLLTKSMALDYATRRIRVNAICPAYIETDLNREHLARLRETGAYEALRAKHPWVSAGPRTWPGPLCTWPATRRAG